MAWETFERNGEDITSGDQPIDEIAHALEKILVIYQEEQNRKPKINELLYAIETVLGADPEKYLLDPGGVELGDILFNRNFEE